MNGSADMQSLVDGFKLCRKIAAQAPLKNALQDELTSKKISYVRELLTRHTVIDGDDDDDDDDDD